jgi:hypothetical protein
MHSDLRGAADSGRLTRQPARYEVHTAPMSLAWLSPNAKLGSPFRIRRGGESAMPRGNPQVQISRRKLQNCRFQLEKISFLLSAVCF